MFCCVGTTERADITGDGAVDSNDLAQLLVSFGKTECNLPGDMDLDGTVNTSDLTTFLLKFGTSGYTACTPPVSSELLAPPGGSHQAGLGGHVGGFSVGRAPAPAQSTATMNQTATPPGPVIAAFGFSTAEQYEAWVSTLNERELDQHLAQVFAVIKALGLP